MDEARLSKPRTQSICKLRIVLHQVRQGGECEVLGNVKPAILQAINAVVLDTVQV